MTTTNITNVSDASWSNNNPNELDYLRPNAFKFQIHNIPNVSYFCQAARLLICINDVISVPKHSYTNHIVRLS